MAESGARLYTLLTGNSGLRDNLDTNPRSGTGWRLQCELVDDGSIADNRAVLNNPEGAELGRVTLTQFTLNDVRALILQDIQNGPQASQHQGVLPDGPAARTRYTGTTGHKLAAGTLRSYDVPAERWTLEVGFFKGMPADHIQLLQDSTVIGDVPVLPIDTLIARATGAIREYRAGGQSATPEEQQMPGISAEAPPADPEPARPECVKCADCGTVHAVERQEGEVAQLMRQCNSCYAERFEPCEAPADGAAYWVVNPEMVTPAVAADQVAASVQPAKEPPAGAAESARAARQVGQSEKDATPPAGEREQLREIRIADIGHFPGGNVREQFGRLEEMAASIREIGIIQPLTVNEIDGRYTLIAGERRLRAAGLARLPTVPCRVMHWTEQQALEAMLVENIQRADLNPIEEARAYQRLLNVLGSQGKVADRVGKSRVHVVELLQLLELPADLQYQVATGIQSVKNGLEYLRRTKEAPPAVKEKVARALTEEKPTSRKATEVIDRVMEQQGVARATGSKGKPGAETPAPLLQTGQAASPQQTSSTSAPGSNNLPFPWQVRRNGELLDDGRLQLGFDVEGSVTVAIIRHSDGLMLSAKFFRQGNGGTSPRTLAALQELMAAMKSDNGQ